MKEFGPQGGGARPWRPPLDPPMLVNRIYSVTECHWPSETYGIATIVEGGGGLPIIWQTFLDENSMKLKKNGPGRGAHPLDPPVHFVNRLDTMILKLLTWSEIQPIPLSAGCTISIFVSIPISSKYRSGTVNSKSFVGKVLLRIK